MAFNRGSILITIEYYVYLHITGKYIDINVKRPRLIRPDVIL